MNNFKSYILGAVASLFLIACDSEDDNNNVSVSENKVDAYIQFESVFADSEFELHKDYTSENNGVLNITTLKYIITDITLHGADGTDDYIASTQESFHIVDASCDASVYKYLTNVPNGEYNKVTFRYGVSDEIQNAGTDAQGEMLVAAEAAGLSWGWTLGYRFMTYEGSKDSDYNFKVHNGSTGALTTEVTTTDDSHNHSRLANDKDPIPEEEEHSHSTGGRVDNSQLVEVDFSADGFILVSDETSPKIHLKVDVSKILSSTDVLDVTEGDIIVDAHKSAQVADNVATMFSIAHIHATDSNFDLPETETCEDTSNPNDSDEHDHDHDHGGDTDEDAHDHSDDETTEDEHDHSDETDEDAHDHSGDETTEDDHNHGDETDEDAQDHGGDETTEDEHAGEDAVEAEKV